MEVGYAFVLSKVWTRQGIACLRWDRESVAMKNVFSNSNSLVAYKRKEGMPSLVEGG